MVVIFIFSNGLRVIYGFNFTAIMNIFSDRKKNTLICKKRITFRVFHCTYKYNSVIEKVKAPHYTDSIAKIKPFSCFAQES